MIREASSRTVAALALALLVAGLVAGYIAGSAAPPGVKTITSTMTERLTETRHVTTSVSITVTRSETPRLPPVKLDVRYAELFSVEYRDGYKLVRDALNRTIILVPRGARPPTGAEGLVVQVPVRRVVLLSATHAALIERLSGYNPEVLKSVVGIAWGGSYEWYLDRIGSLIRNGSIVDVGAAFSPDLERIAALEPDVTFIYTFPGDTLPGKLDELGIPYVVDNEWLEKTALGRFEWIKFVAAFYDMEWEGAEIFESAERRVEELRGLVSGRPAPVVAWFSVYKGTAYASGGAAYTARAIAELGAEYVFKDVKSTGSISLSLEELVTRIAESDVIIYSSDLIKSLNELLAELPGIEESSAVRNKRVYAFAENYYQLGYAYPDSWYMDLAAILYPDVFPGYELRFFRRLA